MSDVRKKEEASEAVTVNECGETDTHAAGPYVVYINNMTTDTPLFKHSLVIYMSPNPLQERIACLCTYCMRLCMHCKFVQIRICTCRHV